ncbi:MAG: acetyltransferase [Planctomycetota bacterium]|nr:MAG: acetyltransferase [Planctomycetota bacterium]
MLTIPPRLPLLIWGAGGHAKVVADVARASGWEVRGFLDDTPSRTGGVFYGSPLMGPSSVLFRAEAEQTVAVFVAIGCNAVRARCVIAAQDAGYSVPVLIHPSAIVSETVEMGAGTIVMAGSVVQADTRMGRGGIINTGASVDHDGQLGEFVHVAPGARLTGEVVVGDQTLIGAGAVVIPRCRIGRMCIVGAGAVVVTDVLDGMTVVGVPAGPHGR